MIVFVCTGNIFRSLTAEYALRRELPGVAASSAGTDDYPHVVRPNVRDYLLEKGLDVRAHRRRTVTREILASAELVVAMSTDHQRFLREKFGLAAPVFFEACGGPSEPLPDIEEVVLDYRTNSAAVDTHVRKTIDTIIDLTPRLARRIQDLRSRR